MTPLTVHPARPGRRHRTAPLLALALLAGGCSGLLPKPATPPNRYTLDVGPTVPPPALAEVRSEGRAEGRTLVVALPAASPGFDSPRMVYLQAPQVLQAFAFHEWIDTPSRMLAPMLVRALQASGAFRVVLQAPSGAVGAWRLETESLRLQHDFGSRPSQVRLTLRAVLVDSATREPLAWREFDLSVPAATEDPAGGAAAAALAAQRVSVAVTEFAAGVAAAKGSRSPIPRREP